MNLFGNRLSINARLPSFSMSDTVRTGFARDGEM